MGKRIWGNRPRVHFILKKPSEKDQRRTFRVLKRTTPLGGKPSHESVQDERIEALNKALLSGSLGRDQCLIQAELVIDDLTAQAKAKLPRAVFNEENRKALEHYWEKEYASRRLADPDAALNRLKRAIEAVGPLSLYSAPREKLQKAVNAKYEDNRQRGVISALNQVLAFLGRDIELLQHAEVIGEIRYLTPDEFAEAQRYVADPIDRLIQKVGFVTGLRQGEVFALTLESIQGVRVFSQYQMDRELDRRRTKARQETRRRVYVLEGGRPALEEWARLPLSIKKEWRNRKHAEIFMRACEKAFPGRPEKHCTYHDLRHSFAVYLASNGVSTTHIAKCLNNSVVVCERYYSGFVLQDETIDSIERIMNSAPVAQW